MPREARRALGLSLLYASAYFLPLLQKEQAYFLPSVWQYVFWPTLVVVAVMAPLIVIAGRLLRRARSTGWPRAALLIGVALFSLPALKSTLDAANFSWMSIVSLLAGSAPSLGKMRVLEVGVGVAAIFLAFGLACLFRDRLSSWVRFLSMLGYAFFVLALIRIGAFPDHVAQASAGTIASPQLQRDALPARDGRPLSKTEPRRAVVWMIFDEMDYEESLGSGSTIRDRLPNFMRLNREAVSASQAYSPARDTEASIPALLLGQPISGIRFNGPASAELRTLEGAIIPFVEEESVFGHLPSGAQSASIIGYFHPYCGIFGSVGTCRSYYLGNAGRWFDGFTNFAQAVFSAGRWVHGFVDMVPVFFWRQFDPMFRISRNTIRDLPAILAQDDRALIFVHVNLPHVPGGYAQKALGMPQTADDHEIYRQNLVVADGILGQALAELRKRAGRQNVLLIVSSDHWHRIDSPEAARPVPFMAWKADEVRGVALDRRISTVHTARLVLDFLDGKVDTQAQIAGWWRDKRFFPTWIPFDDYEF